MGTPDGSRQEVDAVKLAEVLGYQVLGGAVLGYGIGWVGYRMMASIDDHIVEILISLAICVTAFSLSHRLHMSGAIAVVVAGLLIGNRGAERAMSPKVKEYMFAFWEVVDEILNSVLFLLIGLEVLVMNFDPSLSLIFAAAIPIALLGRLVSVSAPILLLSFLQTFSPGSIAILTWGGLRGGVSVALALSLPDSEAKPMILGATFAVVIFSIVVQGLTVKRVVSAKSGAAASDLP